jgi:hypothetical protein
MGQLFNWGENWQPQDHAAYLAACDADYAKLTRVQGPAEFSSDGVTAICVARNEAERLPSFLAHYTRLGIRRIHVIDNASTDRTRAIATSWPNTTVWSTDASYAEACFGQIWIGAVVRRHGLGKWVLNVDVDEHLVYDGMEQHDLTALCAWLQSRRQTRLYAPLIDMYSRLPVSERRGWHIDRLWAAVRAKLRRARSSGDAHYFDHRSFYFDGWGPPDAPNYRFSRGWGGMGLEGGVRERAIAKYEFGLSKVPLAVWDEATAYCIVHFPFPFDLNPDHPYGALLHFKFVGDFERRVAAAIAEDQHWDNAIEYKLYAKWLDEQRPLYDPRHSVRYQGPASLMAERLLLPIDWDRQQG